MRKSAFFVTLVSFFVLCSFASAQQGDAYIGAGTLLRTLGPALIGEAIKRIHYNESVSTLFV